MDLQIAFNLVFGALCAAIGFIVKAVQDELKTLKADMKQYVPRTEYEASRDVTTEWLTRIEAKLDALLSKVK